MAEAKAEARAKKVLVTGPESSGTKLCAHLLQRAGAEVTHHTPRHCIGDSFKNGDGYDAVVLLVRSSHTNARSMTENGHAYDMDAETDDDLGLAYRMVPEALLYILLHLKRLDNVHVITYEALVYEYPALTALLKDLGLDTSPSHRPIKNANAKYYGGEYFRDSTPLAER